MPGGAIRPVASPGAMIEVGTLGTDGPGRPPSVASSAPGLFRNGIAPAPGDGPRLEPVMPRVGVGGAIVGPCATAMRVQAIVAIVKMTTRET